MIEFRLDLYRDEPADLAGWLAAQPDLRVILTCRSEREGGRCKRLSTMRAGLLADTASGNRAMVDFEQFDWQTDAGARARLMRVQSERGSPAGPFPWLILSRHDLEGSPGDAGAFIRAVAASVEGSVAKIAWASRHINDTFAALDLMHEHHHGVIAIAMGEDGLWTRVLARKLGAFATFAAADPEAPTAAGQLTIDEMLERYRWRHITEETKAYGVIGDPIGHSMSPMLFNHWFRIRGINAVYLPLLVRANGDGVRRFLDECRKRPWLDVGGLSVTVPHKSSALHWTGDGADRTARNIGALNTLVFRGVHVAGHNTDCHAAVASIAQALACQPPDLCGVTVDVLGTGGAARALLYGLPMIGCRVTVYGRSPERTKQLADQFQVTPAAWDDRTCRSGEIVINTTSVGMWPAADESPLPGDALSHCRLVFDLIYNPLETRLLRDAGAAGAATLNGLDMFLRQAAMQFALWTGQEAPTEGTAVLLADSIAGMSREQSRRDVDR